MNSSTKKLRTEINCLLEALREEMAYYSEYSSDGREVNDSDWQREKLPFVKGGEKQENRILSKNFM